MSTFFEETPNFSPEFLKVFNRCIREREKDPRFFVCKYETGAFRVTFFEIDNTKTTFDFTEDSLIWKVYSIGGRNMTIRSRNFAEHKISEKCNKCEKCKS